MPFFLELVNITKRVAKFVYPLHKEKKLCKYGTTGLVKWGASALGET